MIKGYLRIASLSLLSLFLFIGADYSVKRWVLDHTHWFNYSKVDFVAPVRAGEPIYMISYNTWYRPTNTEWDDRLFCFKNIGGDTDATYVDGINPKDGRYFPKSTKPRPWKFLNAAPAVGLKCYSKHVITIKIDYGLLKDQVIYSDPITIGE